MKAYALYNIKGGVGKTSSAVNLAYVSASLGHRTLLWDLDPQGAATFTCRVRPELVGGVRVLLDDDAHLASNVRGSDHEGLDVLPADFSQRELEQRLGARSRPTERLARIARRLAPGYDRLIFDCAPGINLVGENVFRAADALLVPTVPTPLSLRTLAQLLKLLRGRPGAPLVLPFFCMVDRRKALHRDVCSYARAHSLGFLDAEIPYSSTVERMGIRRDPVGASAPSSAAARSYRLLWDEVEARSAGVPIAGAPGAASSPRRSGLRDLLEAMRTGRVPEEPR